MSIYHVIVAQKCRHLNDAIIYCVLNPEQTVLQKWNRYFEFSRLLVGGPVNDGDDDTLYSHQSSYLNPYKGVLGLGTRQY